MKLIKREEMNPSMNPLFGSLLSDEFLNWPNSNRNALPAVNIAEDADGFTLDLAVPGFNKEDFKIEVDQDLLTISAEIENESEEKGENYTRREFSKHSFRRSFRLTEDKINQDDIKASYNNGVLSLELPKKEEAKPLPARSISIS